MCLDSSHQKFFDMLRSIDALEGIENTRERDELRKGDLLFVDTTSTDYDGRICAVKIADSDKHIFRRVYVKGDNITLCCMTDGEVIGTYPTADIKIKGIVTGFYRSMPVEAPIDLSQNLKLFETIRTVAVGRYGLSWKEAEAINAYNHGSGIMCTLDAFKYGFLKGQRAANAKTRKEKEGSPDA